MSLSPDKYFLFYWGEAVLMQLFLCEYCKWQDFLDMQYIIGMRVSILTIRRRGNIFLKENVLKSKQQKESKENMKPQR